MNTTGNTILITGGGTGIGQALAQRLHEQGNTVLLAGRRLDVLKKACEGYHNMHPFELDIQDAEAIRLASQRVIADHSSLNVLINNAGIMRSERLDQSRDLADAEETITTNILGPIRLIDAMVEHLVTQPDATIINVTSGLAFVPLLSAPTYNATKAGMHSYTVALREALKGKVEVIELVPPAVQTGLTPGQESRPGYLPLNEFVDEIMGLAASILPSRPMM
jgi:uncharacterized oxidoreductase